MEKETKAIEIDMMEMLRALMNKAKYILLVTLILAVVGFVVSSTLMTPIYEASAKMIVNARYNEDQNITNDQLNSATNLVDVYAIIIRSRNVLEQVITDLDLDESYSQLSGCVSVSSVNNTPVMEVVVHHSDRDKALQIADRILELAPAIIMETVEAGSVKPVEQVHVGNSPISPNIMKNTIIAAMLGFVISCAVVIIMFLTDNTYKTDMDIHNDLHLPVLGVIPTVESCKGPSAKGRTSKGGAK